MPDMRALHDYNKQVRYDMVLMVHIKHDMIQLMIHYMYIIRCILDLQLNITVIVVVLLFEIRENVKKRRRKKIKIENRRG